MGGAPRRRRGKNPDRMTSLLFGSYDEQRVDLKGHVMEAANALRGAAQTTGELSERDLRILEFERQWWKYAGAKETAVREKFDMSSTRSTRSSTP